jgi:glycosyltransferase involved in cell wall biosynthesis
MADAVRVSATQSAEQIGGSDPDLRRERLLASTPVASPSPQISVIIPCLNEEQAVGKVVEQSLEGIRRSGRPGEVLVVDNASTDASAEVAAASGAIVVSEPRRGYGSAYLAGLDQARGEYLVMGDADDTYPMSELAQFVERLDDGDDLVIGSRFKGTIHGDAMPFLNRFVGNPILTGMLNLLFGVKVSDAHCGMRAVRRDALPVLDLHSTGMEFASEMVFKAYRRGLTVSEVPIDYYPRIGESKLNRFGDAWRHVRFMLLYSPSWLYLLPGSVLLLLGLIGMVVLAAGPIDLFGHTWQIHTMLGFVAMTLIGAQVIQLGVFARTYARVRIGERDPLLERLGRHVNLERGLVVGGALSLAAFAGLVAVGAEWAAGGFGALGRAYETALLVTGLGLGIQIVFGAFFLALLTMPLRHASANGNAASQA